MKRILISFVMIMFLMAGCTTNNSTTKQQRGFKIQNENGEVTINLDNILFISRTANENKCTVHIAGFGLFPVELDDLQICDELSDMLIRR